VLVIHDEPPIRRFLKTGLATADYRVVEAADAAEGSHALAAEKLLREVWGPAPSEEVQYLRVFIRGLSRSSNPTRPTRILTELGVGYRLQLPPEPRAQ
jgi:two-component system KDP operon response regulator KdpE